MAVAIDLTLLTECLPIRFSFVLTGLASIWGLGSAITGLIGKQASFFLHESVHGGD